ncbi:hypothetical protein [Burkholderia territorii]|uniref:hypothetical protein n=1 Tax=Burkholderia territorii TaxID=1503055 RepID=UPI0012D8FDED|nr:hypothetical protein [Burkholderia territorii]
MSADTDKEREARIDRLGAEMVMANSPAERQRIWLDLKREISGRSQAQVQRMERQKGLR